MPARDMIASDGHTLTLGDTTVTIYITPGHTPGTLSVLVPVRENGRRTSSRSGAGQVSIRTGSLCRPTSGRRSGSTTSCGRPVRTSSCRVHPTIRILTSSATRRPGGI